MKAIIMAGGEGSRLRPLTCDCPKPMLPLMGVPLMEHAVRLLKQHGIEEIGATLGYLPREIQDYFGDGGRFGVQLHWYIEKTPLGTAGSIGQARNFLDERFIVLSGDGITDFDLSAAIRFHEKNDAMATLVLCRCANPQEYGMVVTDGEGRIRSFHEKPGRCDLYSDRINTGIYILEPEILRRIPENCPYDFGNDLFPALVAEEMPVFGYTAEGYWCDVGDIAAYLRVHADAMDGRIDLDCGPFISKDAILEPGCRLEPPCWIAPGAHICAGAQAGPYAAIGRGCTLQAGASVKHSILFEGAQVGSGAQLRGCVVCAGAQVGENAQLYEESALGTRSRLGTGAILPPGVKLWPEKSVSDGERPEANVVWGSRREQRFISGGLILESPAQASRAAEAICTELRPREILLGRGSSAIAAAMWHAAAAGAMAQGAQLVDAGVCSLPQLRHALASLHTEAALLAEEDRLVPLGRTGAILPERRQRSILKLLERQDFPSPFSGITRPMISAGRTDVAYVAACAACFTADPALAPQIALCCESSHILGLTEQAFARAGFSLRSEWNPQQLLLRSGEVGVLLSSNGEEVHFMDENGRLDETQRQLACAWTALEQGASRLILPMNATRAIEQLARSRGAHAIYPSGERAAWMNTLAEKEPDQFLLQCDGLRFALSFLSRLVETGQSLDQWRMQLPSVFRSARMVRLPLSQSGRVLRSLAEENPDAQLGGGLRLPRRDGWTWLGPDEGGGALQIISEAGDMETADGMCDFFEAELLRRMEKQD